MKFVFLQYCPPGQRFYAANTRLQPPMGGADDTAMNGIEFLCR